MLYQNILETIGNTPIVKINKLNVKPKVNLYIKLEGQNPGGSVKDRIALYMIEQAEKRNELSKNKIILEASSGNMGIALAMVGSYKNYKVKIIMSAGVSLERRKMLKALGADLILTDIKLGTQGALLKAKTLTKNQPNKYWLVNQFNNQDNLLAHFHGIAKEIINEVKPIDYLVVASGTSGTLMGLSSRFKIDSPNTKIISVFPTGGYKIQGIQNPKEDFIGSLYQLDDSVESVVINPDYAYQQSRVLAKKEGIFLGMSSGAALYVGLQIAKKIDSGNIVVISADRGEKYLSTKLYE